MDHPTLNMKVQMPSNSKIQKIHLYFRGKNHEMSQIKDARAQPPQVLTDLNRPNPMNCMRGVQVDRRLNIIAMMGAPMTTVIMMQVMINHYTSMAQAHL
mmetsp:Transcript_3722/g.5603  ORF Transcript_3722/g.5603 Transcript_3722/m.5603 type:complete len:99 (+) Transcript_3722:25-321(+)